MDVASLANLWYEECQNSQLEVDAYGRLSQSLRAFMPSDGVAGIVFEDDSPIVLLLTDSALISFLPPGPEENVKASAMRLSSVTELSVVCTFESRPRGDYRVCTWTLSSPEGSFRTLRTRRPARNSWADDNAGENVMLAVAAELGWNTPLLDAALESSASR
jgi:hypothetical protein